MKRKIARIVRREHAHLHAAAALLLLFVAISAVWIFVLGPQGVVGRSYYFSYDTDIPSPSDERVGEMIGRAYVCTDLYPKSRSDFYVDGQSLCGPCSDDGPGTVRQPWCTIERAFKTSATRHLERSGKLYIREGTYRFDSVALGTELSLSLDISGTAANPTIISGYPGEKPMIYLSDRVQGWERYAGRPDKNIWMIDWKSYLQQNHRWQYLYPYAEGKRAPQVVAIDENPIILFQEINSLKNGWTWMDQKITWRDGRFPGNTSSVGTDQLDMDQGTTPTFYYESDEADPDFGKLFVWLPDGTDPNDRNMEVSVSPALPFAFADSPMNYIHIKNLGVRFSSGHFGAIILSGSNNRFEDLDASYNAVTGLSGICKNCLVKNSIFRFNGNAGAGLYGENTVYEGNVLESNNWRKYARDVHAGGIKFVENIAPDGTIIGTPKGMVFKNNLVKDNDGFGIWFDGANVENVLVEGNVVVGNSWDGVMVEISRGTAKKPIRVRDNIFLNNGHGKFGEKERHFDGGGFISGSQHVIFENNLVYNSPGGIKERPVNQEYPLQHNALRNNIFLNVSFPLTIQREEAGVVLGDTIAERNIYLNADHSPYWDWRFAWADDPNDPNERDWIALREKNNKQMFFCYGWCFDWEGNGKDFTQWQALGFDQNSILKPSRAIDMATYGISLTEPPKKATKDVISRVRQDVLR